MAAGPWAPRPPPPAPPVPRLEGAAAELLPLPPPPPAPAVVGSAGGFGVVRVGGGAVDQVEGEGEQEQGGEPVPLVAAFFANGDDIDAMVDGVVVFRIYGVFGLEFGAEVAAVGG